MDDFLRIIKAYLSEIIGIIQIFVAIYLDCKNCHRK